jgi:AcrR family transcriptional regulator
MVVMQSRRIPTRQAKRAETRARLLAAAGRVFARRGFHAASLAEVAAAAGFSTGAVYSNFDSKDDLFLALLEQRIENRMALVHRVLDAPGTVGDGLRRVGHALSDVTAREREWWLLFIEFWLHAARTPRLGKKLARYYAAVRTGIAALIREQARAVVLPPEQLAAAIEALGSGLMLQKLLDEKALPNDTFATLLAAMCGAAGMREGAAETDLAARAGPASVRPKRT